MARDFVPDKVYLKDTRTGIIHEYEQILSNVEGFVAHVPNPTKKVVPAAKPPAKPQDYKDTENLK
jgi:hypothetical protein